MTKPLKYYVSGEHLDKLCERFGQELDLLERNQKLQLRVMLSYYILGKDCMGDSYSINDAWMESLQPIMCHDTEIIECLEIFKDISIRDTESLLVALQAQCTQGNARLKTASETITYQLINLGIPTELASSASKIIHQIDNERPRTEQEQTLINQVHAMLVRGK